LAHRSVIQNGKNGLVIPVNDSALLAEAVLKLLGNDELCDKISKNARKTIEEKYSIEIVASSLYRLYKKLVAQSDAAKR
jgi:glycosyltransferase involved in cell wall biosynthesis